MTEAMQKDLAERFHNNEHRNMCLYVVHSDSLDAAKEYKAELETVFPDIDIEIAQLSLSVACHIGPGALALACAKKAI